MYGKQLIVAAAMAAMLFPEASQGAQAGAPLPFQAQLDEALQKLKGYNFGGDAGPLNALSALVPATHGQPELRRTLVAKLAGVLTSDAPLGAKDFACRQLSLIGTADAVPALAALLPDEKLSNMARYALERIPDPAADDALRQALEKTRGKVLVGVINSLGNRRDARSAAELAPRLSDADAQVAGAAAAALGKIGVPALAPLTAALAGAPAPLRAVVADACLLCADALLAQGKRDDAAALYDRVRAADVPAPVRIAATRGAVLARPAGALPLVVEQLQSREPGRVALALFLVRELPGGEATKRIADELARLAAEKQVLLLAALADRRDAAAVPAVTALAKGGETPVRAAALRTLGALGDVGAVPILLDAAGSAEGAVAQAAAQALAALPAKAADAALLGLIENPDRRLRRLVIESLGQRRTTTAAAALLPAARGADADVRVAAIKALGTTAGAADVPALVGLVTKPQSPQELATAESTLAAVCERLPNKDPGADAVLTALPQADPASRCALLRALGRIGVPQALPAMQAATADANPAIQDTALRVLSEWPDPAALPALLEIAQRSANRKHKLLALRGYIRLIGVSTQPAEKKFELCQGAIALTDRDEERKLVLGVLGTAPGAGALALVVPYLDNAATKDEACVAAVAIAEKIADQHPAAVAAAMKKAIGATQNDGLLKRARTALDRAERKAAGK